MSKLTPKERALLDVARKGWGPSARVKEAVRAGVPGRLRSEPTLGDGAPGPQDVTSPTGRITSASALVRGPRGMVAGLAVVGLCVAFGVRGIGGVRPSPSSTGLAGVAPVATTSTAASSTSAYEVPTPPLESRLGPIAEPGPEPAPRPEPAPPEAAPVSSPDRGALDPPSKRSAGVAARPAVSSERAADTLAEEVALVRAAQKSLRDGAPKEALGTLATHAARFPRGALREERMTLQVLALCALGDLPRARSVRAELERLAPDSSHLRRLACAAP